jgi:hypothetical protein
MLAFADSMASRREQWAALQVPSPRSSIELTTYVVPGGEVAATAGENSEVQPVKAVAVAVTRSPGATGSIGVNVYEKAPAADETEPRKLAPSPFPDGSAASLE